MWLIFSMVTVSPSSDKRTPLRDHLMTGLGKPIALHVKTSVLPWSNYKNFNYLKCKSKKNYYLKNIMCCFEWDNFRGSFHEQILGYFQRLGFGEREWASVTGSFVSSNVPNGQCSSFRGGAHFKIVTDAVELDAVLENKFVIFLPQRD